MIKQVLLASSMMIAGPVLAQTTGNQDQAAPGRTPMQAESSAGVATAGQTGTTPVPTDAATAQAAPAQTQPVQPSTATAQAGTQPATATPAQPAPGTATGTAQAGTTPAPAGSAPATAQAAAGATAQPTNAPTEVAAIVDREFGAYDKDGDGKLSQAEFSAWMVALKTASDPATKADSPETKKWVGAAFAQADTDKNSGLTKTELTGFLSQGQS